MKLYNTRTKPVNTVFGGICGGQNAPDSGDTLDALLSNRPYRKGCPLKEARGTIALLAGTQFDPEMVSGFNLVTDEAIEACSARYRELDEETMPTTEGK